MRTRKRTGEDEKKKSELSKLCGCATPKIRWPNEFVISFDCVLDTAIGTVASSHIAVYLCVSIRVARIKYFKLNFAFLLLIIQLFSCFWIYTIFVSD